MKQQIKPITRDEAIKQRCVILINSCTINMQLYFVRTKINTAIRRLTNKNLIKEISEAFENKKNQLTQNESSL